MEQKYGLYLGRFQPFHDGHGSIVRQAWLHCDKLIIGIGSAQEKRTERAGLRHPVPLHRQSHRPLSLPRWRKEQIQRGRSYDKGQKHITARALQAKYADKEKNQAHHTCTLWSKHPLPSLCTLPQKAKLTHKRCSCQ